MYNYYISSQKIIYFSCFFIDLSLSLSLSKKKEHMSYPKKKRKNRMLTLAYFSLCLIKTKLGFSTGQMQKNVCKLYMCGDAPATQQTIWFGFQVHMDVSQNVASTKTVHLGIFYVVKLNSEQDSVSDSGTLCYRKYR